MYRIIYPKHLGLVKKMTEETKKNEEYPFGSKELKDQLKVEETEFVRFNIGEPKNIIVLKDVNPIKNVKEFEAGTPVIRFDIKILVDKQEKTWSVSRKVLSMIDEYLQETTEFKIIRRDMAYDVIPLGIKA